MTTAVSPGWLLDSGPFLFLAGISFSRDGRYLALAERRDCKDYVSIFVCSDWQLLRVRPCSPNRLSCRPSGQAREWVPCVLFSALRAPSCRLGKCDFLSAKGKVWRVTASDTHTGKAFLSLGVCEVTVPSNGSLLLFC